MDATGTGKK